MRSVSFGGGGLVQEDMILMRKPPRNEFRG